MIVLFIIIGIIIGGILSFVFKDKLMSGIIKEPQQFSSSNIDLEEVSKFKKIIVESNNTIDDLKTQIKSFRIKVDELIDSKEDTSDIIDGYKVKNHALAQQIEKLKNI